MSKIPEPTPALNRLRAAAGLIPLIEDGLRQSKITAEKASLMAEFCSWAAQQATEGSPEALRLADDIKAELTAERIEPVYKNSDLLGSGSYMMNLACTGSVWL